MGRRSSTIKKDSPILNAVLFLISVVLLIITGPFGLIYGALHSFYKKRLAGLGSYLLEIAISIDQLGNVVMQHLLNRLWLRKNAYLFGNRDETISSALGRNKKLGTLNSFGRGIDQFLDFLDPNHSLNSIDHYIEPSKNTLNLVAWIHMHNDRLLCIQRTTEDLYTIPSFFCTNRESSIATLKKKIAEELHISIIDSTIKEIGIFEGPAENNRIVVRLHCFSSDYKGKLHTSKKIPELVWLSAKDIELVPRTDQQIFRFLFKKNYLSNNPT